MLLCKGSRGWISGVDVGSNKEYFLYTQNWCFFISPAWFRANYYVDAERIREDGRLDSSNVDKAGGVL